MGENRRYSVMQFSNSSSVLYSPDFEKEFILQTDASDRSVGAVLSQMGDDDKEHPVAYFSK